MSAKSGRWVWSNADRGRGKGSCGRPQVGTFLCYSSILCRCSLWVMPKYKLKIVIHLQCTICATQLVMHKIWYFLTIKYFMKYFSNVYVFNEYFKMQCHYARGVSFGPMGPLHIFSDA